jgi:hypothetical protein
MGERPIASCAIPPYVHRPLRGTRSLLSSPRLHCGEFSRISHPSDPTPSQPPERLLVVSVTAHLSIYLQDGPDVIARVFDDLSSAWSEPLTLLFRTHGEQFRLLRRSINRENECGEPNELETEPG